MAKQIIFISSLLFHLCSCAQSGCTDPQANNFDPNALTNDGSCSYPATSYSMTLINNLSDQVQENSGLIRVGNFLYTFNDSGSDAKIYELDTTGAVQRSIVLTGATNVDWEAITSNSTHVFIGDFGNNSGNRQNLCVYRFLKSDLLLDTIVAEKLPFYWSDQVQFNAQANAHNFDCEAFVAREDSLVLFSK
ncbi:MAG: T9SS C-terminal target domain-containing protein, partial [Flavobacteriia bacterium]|nr:T9SS C-terminal target domain-containing protein [Flavobacteriia bacterium]